MIGYPAQTSLIPVQVALARFLENQGFLAVFGNYPYWYLGTTPFRFLTGPILPVICLTLHRVFSSLSLFEIVLGLVGVCWVVGGIGVYLLIKTLEKHRMAVFAALFYLLGPIVPFLFRFSDGLYLIAFSFLPFTLLMYLGLLKNWTRTRAGFLVILTSFLILLDTLILPTLILGMAAIFLAQVGWKRVEEKLKQTLLVLSSSFLVATLWYTPAYWLTLLGAPSLAGKGLAGVIIWLGKLLPTALAFGIAVFSVRFFKKRNLLRDFCFYWLFIYVCLTLLRFLSDPDFWLDWSSYSLELQLGLAILGGLVVSRSAATRIKANVKRIYANERIVVFVVCCLLFVVWLFVTNKYVFGTLQKDITKTVEYRIGKYLREIAKPGERVFLSGSTAFWLNAFFDIPQVRGGVDQAAVNQSWRQAVWEIRDGSTGSPQGVDKSVEWLKKLGISYLVVHTKESEEYYHDFSHQEKFEATKLLKKVFSDRGDIIYRVEEK